MHNSDAVSILNCALDSSCFCYERGPEINVSEDEHFKHIIHRLCIQCIQAFRPLQTMGNFLDISVAACRCLCVSGKVVLWSKHFDIIMLVPMLYLKFCDHIYIYRKLVDFLRKSYLVGSALPADPLVASEING